MNNLNQMKEKAFTLIELLIVIGLLLVIGSLTIVILITALRGATKTNTITDVRQNGNYVVSQLTKMIRDSQFNGVSNDNVTYVTDCLSVITPTPIPTQYSYLKVTGFDRGITVFQCIPNTNIASNSSNLLDQTVVSLQSCFFTCTQSTPTDSQVININFSLKQANTTGLLETTASGSAIPFSTSVVIRNR